MKNIQCPVCKNFTLPQDYAFEICKVCYWQDEGLDRVADPDEVVGGPNKDVTLNQAIANYKEFGAYHKDFISNVRKPLESETPENNVD